MRWPWEDKSMWEFQAAFDGFALSKGVEPEPEPMSFERLKELTRR
jgi:hypothetical protein